MKPPSRPAVVAAVGVVVEVAVVGVAVADGVSGSLSSNSRLSLAVRAAEDSRAGTTTQLAFSTCALPLLFRPPDPSVLPAAAF